MITCNLMGGLGNQLFQIFTTISYALDNNDTFLFLYSKMYGERASYWDNFLNPLKKNTLQDRIQGTIMREKAFHYEVIPKKKENENIILHGYFQSEKYFEKNTLKIVELSMNLKQIQDKIIKREFSSFDQKNTISMHFRLGDYKTIPDYHPVLKVTYYKNSIEKIEETTKISEWTIIYFCEDGDAECVNKDYIDYLKKIFPKCTFLRAKPELSDWGQMVMMSCCQHHIIANSTFSWWGAYLHFSDDKLVCWPSLWFGSKLLQHNIADLIPEKKNWLRVSVE